MWRSAARLVLLGGLGALCVAAVELPHAGFEEDFHDAWREIGSTYAYFDLKATRWSEIPRLYAPDLARVRNRREFVGLLEQVVEELYDPHAHLTVNTPASPRLVPSGADLWAEWHGDRAVIVEVRARIQRVSLLVWGYFGTA